MNEKKVIAIFGGAFNPPINSHILLANEILETYDMIEKLIFVPVSSKYNKVGLESDEHRYNMLKLLCKNKNKIEISDIELRQNKQLYTIETLNLIQEQYGDEYSIWFILGTDNLKELELWKNPEQILNKYKILVLKRNDDNINEIIENSLILKGNRKSLIYSDKIKKIHLSSTMVRNKIKNNENIDEYVPKEIIEYINKNNLYKNKCEY